MAITIKGNIQIKGITTVGNYGGTPIVSYSFAVFTDGGVCNDSFGATVYSSSAVLGIGSSLYTDLGLTTPTTYSAISNPDNPGNDYFILTGNVITSSGLCD